MKKNTGIIAKILSAAMILLCAVPLCSCGGDSGEKDIKIVSTIFPSYDFARNIAADNADVDMLISPGADSHSYDPTPKDMLAVNKCDIFIYVGGESDVWAEEILDSADNPDMIVIKLIDCTEELYMEEGHDHDHEHAGEYDEHVWTNPRNAMLICEKIADALCKVDSENEETYKANLASYNAELSSLDEAFKQTVANGKRNEIVFGDRFPLIYFAKAYGLEYHSAFPGCSSETEPSGATVASLINKVKEDKIPVVFYLELSDGKIADTICEATGAKKMCFHACHNVSKDDFEAGEGYIDLMKKNVEVLKAALN